MSGGFTFESIETGAYHSCGITDTGETFCWGYGEVGQLGNGSGQDQPTPVPVGGGMEFRSLSLGKWSTCGVTAEGHGHCWGGGRHGALGTGSEEDQFLPTPVAGDLTFAIISPGGWNHASAATPTGLVYGWGWAAMGQVGIGDLSSGDVLTPVLTRWRPDQGSRASSLDGTVAPLNAPDPTRKAKSQAVPRG